MQRINAAAYQGARGTVVEDLNILLIATLRPREARTVKDHALAFQRFSKHRVFVYNHYNFQELGYRALPRSLELERFDVVVVHYSTYLMNEASDYLDAQALSKLSAFRGLKVLFRQDEYSHVDGLVQVLCKVAVDVIFTTFSEEDASRLYDRPGLEHLRKVNTLTGYVPEELLAIPVNPIAQRKIDVGYRSRKVPFWVGSLGAEKFQIAERFRAISPRYSLSCDISVREGDRLYGPAWIDFMRSCRVMLGTESGASIVDLTGNIREDTELYLAGHPEATFEEVRDLLFAGKEWQFNHAQISPRSFEAAALRTGMVLYEGRYSGFLEPGRHYVPLKKDFSNIDEVVSVIKDHGRIQRMTLDAYEEVARSPHASYKYFIEQFDRVVEEEVTARATRRAGKPYSPAEFLTAVAQSDDHSRAVDPAARRMFRRVAAEVARPLVAQAVRIRPLGVRSKLRFCHGHGLENAIGEPRWMNHVAAMEDQALPQEFEIELPKKTVVERLHLRWQSEVDCARDFSVILLRRGAAVMEHRVGRNSAASNVIALPRVRASHIRVSVSAFSGQERLLLRLIEVYGHRVPSPTRRLWRKLPYRLQKALRPLLTQWLRRAGQRRAT